MIGPACVFIAVVAMWLDAPSGFAWCAYAALRACMLLQLIYHGIVDVLGATHKHPRPSVQAVASAESDSIWNL